MIGDIMHPGLINIINEGAKYGDVMVGLFTDKAIATHKRLPYLTYAHTGSGPLCERCPVIVTDAKGAL